jgi:nicotinate-nucleotide adenylyltransferase
MNDQIHKCREIANCFEFMPDSNGAHSQKELDHLFLKSPISNSVTFFGGSFNPFHAGHLACLNLCPEKNILIVPDRNPFKSAHENENCFDYFTELALKVKDTQFSLYPGFLIKTEGNPTSSWLPFVKLPEKNFLMGDDSYIDLLKWKNPDVIAKSLSKLYVAPRKYTKDDYIKVELELLKFNPNLEIHYLDEHPYMNLSSTELRKR